MNPDSYVVICRQQVAGRFHKLAEALQLAGELAGEQFADYAVWKGRELVAVALCGGRVLELPAETFTPTEEPDGIIAALRPTNN